MSSPTKEQIHEAAWIAMSRRWDDEIRPACRTCIPPSWVYMPVDLEGVITKEINCSEDTHTAFFDHRLLGLRYIVNFKVHEAVVLEKVGCDRAHGIESVDTGEEFYEFMVKCGVELLPEYFKTRKEAGLWLGKHQRGEA